jgi:hypothetical protein
MDYETIQRTIYNLLNIRELFTIPDNWGQSHTLTERAVTLDQAFAVVGCDTGAYVEHADDNVFPGDLSRGQIPEAAWFVRQAMNKVAPEFDRLIYKWNDAPERVHQDVLDLVTAAINLAKEERSELWASDSRFDNSGLVLDRWGSRDGSRVCAMSAISRKLGCDILTDVPRGVDPALAALVNLLNDRATDQSRQMLTSRLNHIPYSGWTNVTSLIARIFFPLAMKQYGFKREIEALVPCLTREKFGEVYHWLSQRFIDPDGSSVFATGCATLAAALRANDNESQDLLAISAASQLVSFEGDWGWAELLHLLDYIVGIEDQPYLEDEEVEWFGDIDASAEIEEVYDCGIKVQWFPALVARFPDQLEAIAEQILEEVTALDRVSVFMHRFSFEGVELMIATSWDNDLDVLSADADLLGYLDPAGEIDLDGDATQVLIPVPASDAKTVH